MLDQSQRSSSRGHLVGIVAAIICVLAALLLLVNRQCVVDQISTWQYSPGNDIVALADSSGMSGKGRFYFYASHPAIESADTFNKECERKESSTAILGCYDGRSIFVYNVTDSRLDGIKAVTAAHEMLHAAYARLGDDEKRQVDKLVEAEYDKLKNDSKFAERMAFYARTEPGERDNELHSVIGTEVGSISTELEAHYKVYFDDRGKVVALHNKYASIFDELQAKSDALSSELTALGDEIEKGTYAYNVDVTKLNVDIKAFNDRANGNGFSSASEFNTERNNLVDRANQLDGQRASINDKITHYDALRKELMSVASQSQALNRSIDSSLAPAPSL